MEFQIITDPILPLSFLLSHREIIPPIECPGCDFFGHLFCRQNFKDALSCCVDDLTKIISKENIVNRPKHDVLVLRDICKNIDETDSSHNGAR